MEIIPAFARADAGASARGNGFCFEKKPLSSRNFFDAMKSRRKNVRDLPRTRAHLKPPFGGGRGYFANAKFRDDNDLVFEKKPLSSRNFFDATKSGRKNVRDLPRTRAFWGWEGVGPPFGGGRGYFANAKFRDDNDLVFEKKPLSSRNFFDATKSWRKNVRDLPRTRAFLGWEGLGRRSAEVADVSLARNSAMTIN